MERFSLGLFDEGYIVGSLIFSLFDRIPIVDIYFNARIEKSLIDALEKKTPDVLLMNLAFKNQINFSLAKKIKSAFPDLKITGFVCGTELSHEAVFRLINSGVVSILTDANTHEDILQTIKMVAEKGFHINEVVNEAMVTYCKRKKLLHRSFGPSEKFTEREIKIVEEKKKGKTSMEIADQLFLSKKSIDGILQSLYSRFDCRNFHELERKYDMEKPVG